MHIVGGNLISGAPQFVVGQQLRVAADAATVVNIRAKRNGLPNGFDPENDRFGICSGIVVFAFYRDSVRTDVAVRSVYRDKIFAFARRQRHDLGTHKYRQRRNVGSDGIVYGAVSVVINVFSVIAYSAYFYPVIGIGIDLSVTYVIQLYIGNVAGRLTARRLHY